MDLQSEPTSSTVTAGDSQAAVTSSQQHENGEQVKESVCWMDRLCNKCLLVKPTKSNSLLFFFFLILLKIVILKSQILCHKSLKMFNFDFFQFPIFTTLFLMVIIIDYNASSLTYSSFCGRLWLYSESCLDNGKSYIFTKETHYTVCI